MAAATGKIITIGRSYGAGGRSIGRQVAEDLKIPYYDSELLAETAKSSGLDEKYLASVDEKEINDAALYMSVGYMSPTYSSVRQIAANAQREVIEKIAAEGPCVIVGRRANEILAEKPNLLSVFITASVESRIVHVMNSADKERAAYYNQFSGNEWGYAATYDLCINTDVLGADHAAQIIEFVAGKT